MKCSLSSIALMSCLAIGGLSAGGCSQTAGEARGDSSPPHSHYRVPFPAFGCAAGKPRLQRPKQGHHHLRRHVRTQRSHKTAGVIRVMGADLPRSSAP
jgi:hypothetical protein